MPLRFACECGASLQIKDELIGKRIRCPKCQKSTLVQRNVSGTGAPLVDHRPPTPGPEVRTGTTPTTLSAHEDDRRNSTAAGTLSESPVLTRQRWIQPTNWVTGSQRMFHHGLLATQTELLYVTGPYTELGIAIVGLAVIWIIVHWAVTAQVLCLPVPILVTLAAINDWSNIVPKRRKAWSDLKQSAIESLRANTTACKAFPINSLTLVDYDEAKKTLVVQAGKLRCNLTIRPSNADQCKAFVAHCKSLAGLPG